MIRELSEDDLWQARISQWKERSNWVMLKQTLQGYVCKTPEVHGKQAIVKKAFAQLVRTKRSLRGQKVQENFLGERETLQYLNSHRDMPIGIVRLYHSWDDEDEDEGQGVHYYLQEFVKDGDLFELTSNFWLTNPRAFELLPNGRRQQVLERWHENVIDMFAQLVEACAWMHSKGVIHLDISLENIMVEKAPRDPRLPLGQDNVRYTVRVIDFGTAQRRVDGNFACDNHRVGKSAYMAPEVYDRKYGDFDGRAADTWSLGVVLFQMLVGSQLYQRATLQDQTLHYAMRQGIPALLRGWKRLDSFPDHGCDLLSRIFKFEQVGRIAMTEIWRHEFCTLASHPPQGIWESAMGEDIEMDSPSEEKTVEGETRHDQAGRPNDNVSEVRRDQSDQPISDGENDQHRGEGEPRALQFRHISVSGSEGVRLQRAMDHYGFTEEDMTKFFELVDRKSRDEFVEILASYETLHRRDCSSLFTLITRHRRGSDKISGNDILKFCVREFTDPQSFEVVGQRLLFETLGKAGAGILSREESDAPMIDAGATQDQYDDRF